MTSRAATHFDLDPCRCRNRRTARGAVALVSVAVLACSCSGGSDGPAAPVLATTSIWADIAEHVACGELDVPAMIPPGTDAHSYEPSVRDADLLRDADAVVSNGLGLEETLHDTLDAAEADGVDVVEVGAAASPDHAEEDGHTEDDGHADDGAVDDHDHGGEDPHVWMDPDRIVAAVPLIAQLLKSVDGVELSDERIDQCAADYTEELEALSAEIDELLAPIEPERRKLVTNHEALGYFADRFDFEVIGAVVPSTSSLAETNPRDLDELEATMRRSGVDVIFAETTGATALADALADRLGANASVVELHTESISATDEGPTSYVEMMRTNAELIAGALA